MTQKKFIYDHENRPEGNMENYMEFKGLKTAFAKLNALENFDFEPIDCDDVDQSCLYFHLRDKCVDEYVEKNVEFININSKNEYLIQRVVITYQQPHFEVEEVGHISYHPHNTDKPYTITMKNWEGGANYAEKLDEAHGLMMTIIRDDFHKRIREQF